MNDRLTIREADEHDISIIHHLANVIWPPTYSEILPPGQVAYMMNLFYSPESLAAQFKKHRFLLALSGEEPVGFASFSPLEEPGIYKLHKLYVRTDIQGRGTGRALITHILDHIRSAGAKALDLNVNRLNKARLFYEKLGFAVTREEDIDIGQDFWMNDYVMRKKIMQI